jgi:hypothetical protein
MHAVTARAYADSVGQPDESFGGASAAHQHESAVTLRVRAISRGDRGLLVNDVRRLNQCERVFLEPVGVEP